MEIQSEQSRFEELYQQLLKRKETLREPLPAQYDPRHLDCLLHPEKYAPVIAVSECQRCAVSLTRSEGSRMEGSGSILIYVLDAKRVWRPVRISGSSEIKMRWPP